MCELEDALRGRSRDIRRQLQVMTPVTDRRHDGLFQELIEVDQSLAMLRGLTRGQPAEILLISVFAEAVAWIERRRQR
jgi:hypothetical protein